MTATPTPLRELRIRLGAVDMNDVASWPTLTPGDLRTICAALDAALSARQEEVAVKLPAHDEPCNEACGPGCPNRPPQRRSNIPDAVASQAFLDDYVTRTVTPPAASGEAGAVEVVAYKLLSARGVYGDSIPAIFAEKCADDLLGIATPPAASGDDLDAEVQAYRQFHLNADLALLGADALTIDREGSYDAAIENTLNAIRRLAAVAPAGMCTWSQCDADGSDWDTGCGHLFMLNDGSPSENSMSHCCFCGERIGERLWRPDDAAPTPPATAGKE